MSTGAFWDDLADDLQDPELLRHYVTESVRIATIDAVINELGEALEAAGLTKTALARSISVEPSTIRRLLSTPGPNPTLGTLAEVAGALGMRVTLEPLSESEREVVTEPLITGESPDRRALVEHLESRRPRREATPRREPECV